MSTLVLVMGLIGLSYLSGLLGGRGAVRGLGLPSGSEWVVLGFILGPALLGVIDHAVQIDIEPFLYVAIGWVALVVGLDYGIVRSRRVGAGRMLLGAALGLTTVAVVAAIAWLLIPRFELGATATQRWALALGLGAVASETTSNAVRWIAERHGAGGPLAELLDDLAEAKDVAPILAAGVGLCLHPRFDVVSRGWVLGGAIPAVVIAVGALLGVVAAVILSREERVDQSWGIVVGMSLLAIGTAARLRLPVIASMFALGVALGFASRQRRRLLAMIEHTKRSAALPALLMAGARIEPRALRAHALLIATVVIGRVGVLCFTGLFIAPKGPARAAAPLVGLAMLTTGELSMMIGLSFALAFEGSLGAAVLGAAAIVAVLGELVGPPALRAALRRAGELGGEAT